MRDGPRSRIIRPTPSKSTRWERLRLAIGCAIAGRLYSGEYGVHVESYRRGFLDGKGFRLRGGNDAE